MLTNYYVATHWLHNALIMCNNIMEIDPSCYDNMRFDSYDEETDSTVDIYQFFLTNCSEFDVEYLEKHFGLLFTYSDLLDMYVLCVDHWGTGWDHVMVDTDLENAVANEGDKLGL